MDFFFGNLGSHFNQDAIRCPFLKNINEPTNFSFSNPTAFPTPLREGKGPIFEDGPNFETSFRLFHGQNGVVPLSERSSIRTEKSPSESSPAQFNPLAAKAATISLSGFGPGGPFGFDAFSEKWKKENKKSKSSKDESSLKVTLSAGLVIAVYAVLSGGDVWKKIYQYFQGSKFIHVTSLDFSLLSTFAPFWVYNDMTARKWQDKGFWLLPLSIIPFLGPALYLLLRSSLPVVPIMLEPTSEDEK